MHFLGIDLGSSSVKLTLLDGDTGRRVASVHYPETELDILSPQRGWAEQDPDTWWRCIKEGAQRLYLEPGVDPSRIAGIGISYQMHGLVLVDKNLKVLRPSIIWCDSRAVVAGEQAREQLGDSYCFSCLLNSPGNFTAAKLRWVQEHEPEVFKQVYKAMLPGDYVALKLTGEVTTTSSGLSEGTFWDFGRRDVAVQLLDQWGIDRSIIPDLVPNIGVQGRLSREAAVELGLREGVCVSYRAGDQPNNAFSLNALQPGEIAATAGTSGVIYGVTDEPLADRQSRVNTFLHVNDTPAAPRNGILLCVNGAGRTYSWLRQLLRTGSDGGADYPYLNELASRVNIGSEGLLFYPFGNGAERIFQNRDLGASMQHIDFNRHGLAHMVRAAQEAVVFAMRQGFDVLRELGLEAELIRVARSNMFLSPVFASAFANVTQTPVELFDTDGAEGAARGAALGSGFYGSSEEAFGGLRCLDVIEPQQDLVVQYEEAYLRWCDESPANARRDVNQT